MLVGVRNAIVAMSAGLTLSCAGGGGHAAAPRSPGAPTFADDVAFLRAHGEVIVLEGAAGARVAVSPAYQGRVMTSAASPDGASFGWIHRAFIDAKKTGTSFDNYGGEDRFWLGPEGSRFSLYFPSGSELVFDRWQVPHALQEGAWNVTERDARRVRFAHTMEVTSRTGRAFRASVARTIALLDEAALARFGERAQEAARGLSWVGFESENVLTNAGSDAWTAETGLPSIWILGMYAPARDGHVVLPFRDAPGDTSPIVNDAYFGKVPAERLVVDRESKVIRFTSDGELRGKIGLAPSRATPVLGSYSRASRLLTVVTYAPAADPNAPYVSAAWDATTPPFGGDAINSYNDGPVGPGKPSLGGFYELETSSPAAALAPGASIAHAHATFHFVGDEAALDPLARAVLGVSLAEVAGP